MSLGTEALVKQAAMEMLAHEYKEPSLVEVQRQKQKQMLYFERKVHERAESQLTKMVVSNCYAAFIGG